MVGVAAEGAFSVGLPFLHPAWAFVLLPPQLVADLVLDIAGSNCTCLFLVELSCCSLLAFNL